MNFLKRFFSQSKQQEEKASSTSKLFTSLGSNGAVWSKDRYDVFARETYLKNTVAFRCIDEVSKAVASVPWGLFKKTSDKKGRVLVPKHEILDLINRPNPEESFSFLMLKATAFLIMAGNSFFERVVLEGGRNKGVPKELYILRPDRTKVTVNKVTGTLGGFIFEAGGKKVIWEVDPITLQSDVLQIKTFHPLNDWYGSPVTKSAAREVDTSNQATEWNKNLLDNQGRPGMVLTSPEVLGDDQFERLEQMLNEKYAGGESAGRNLILEGGMVASPYSMTPAEMEYLKGKEALARSICMVYGVPPMLIGIPGEATFANYKEARLSFWENTVIWYLNLFRSELNNWLFISEDELFIDYILDEVPALTTKREMIWERAQKADFLTINEKREMVGMEETEGGDVLLVPINLLPLTSNFVEENNENDPNEEDLDEGEE